ncbi:hypothetical protein [Streptomyces sp. NPDC051561]|uniref:hypothetical protein n=1 Tax=Streptomyces sp. NPDC051561 TaxID=3365658 RepID=UPI00379B7CB2
MGDDIDEIEKLLQTMSTVTFPSAWKGCLIWSSGLVSWHLAQRPSTWTPLQQQPA